MGTKRRLATLGPTRVDGRHPMRLRALHDASKSIGLLQDESEIAATGARIASVAFSVPAVVLMTRRDAKARLYPAAATCALGIEAIPELDATFVDTTCIVRSGRALSASDIAGEDQQARTFYAGFALAPLQVGGETIGMLGIERAPPSLEPIDLEFLCGLASVIAVAIAQARSRLRAIDEERKRACLTQYFSPQVATHLASGAAAHVSLGVRRDVSVLFADIRGFTAFSHGRQPTELMAFLNHYFSRMIHPVLAHGGMVDKLLGDGILAVFGAPFPLADHALKAAACALEMLALAAGIPFGLAESVRVGIGIESGPVVIGDVGGGGFLDFTVLGDTVNVASRIEGLTKTFGVNALVGPRAYAQIGNRGRFESMTPHSVRGVSEEIQTYRLLSVEGG